MDEFNERIKEFIITEVAPDLGLTDIADDEPLIETGIVDSLGVLRIMAFLDESFGVDLGAVEINLENFKDLRTIRALVRSEGGG